MRLGSLVVGEDLSTALSGAFNIGYFAGYAWRSGASGRRVGAATLALVNAAVVVEAIFSQAMFWGQGLPAGAWVLVRLPLMAATLFVSLLILRRLRS